MPKLESEPECSLKKLCHILDYNKKEFCRSVKKSHTVHVSADFQKILNVEDNGTKSRLNRERNITSNIRKTS